MFQSLRNFISPPPPTDTQQVEGWRRLFSKTNGWCSGSTKAPGVYASCVQVSSWLQVPAILSELQRDPTKMIRVDFPAPTAIGPLPDAIKAEQLRIYTFLRNAHTTALGELRRTLPRAIEQSYAFTLVPPDPDFDVARNMGAQKWVNAHSFDPANADKRLRVNDVHSLDTSVSALSQIADIRKAFQESADGGRPFIFLLPGATPEYVNEFGQVVDTIVNPVGVAGPFDAKTLPFIKAWVGELDTEPLPPRKVGRPCRAVEEKSLAELLDPDPKVPRSFGSVIGSIVDMQLLLWGDG